MVKLKISLFLFFILLVLCKLSAQEVNPIEANNKMEFYGGLNHQHHEYYNKVFSFQGIEGGAILEHHYLFGVYGSTFVSSLEVDINNAATFLQMWQGGLMTGIMTDNRKFLHAGLLFNIGYISIVGDETNFPLFKVDNPSIRMGGLILDPQLFTELNVTKWMKIRTGLAYDFYGFKDQSLIKKSDLQSISFNFGFLFGSFTK